MLLRHATYEQPSGMLLCMNCERTYPRWYVTPKGHVADLRLGRPNIRPGYYTGKLSDSEIRKRIKNIRASGARYKNT